MLLPTGPTDAVHCSAVNAGGGIGWFEHCGAVVSGTGGTGHITPDKFSGVGDDNRPFQTENHLSILHLESCIFHTIIDEDGIGESEMCEALSF